MDYSLLIDESTDITVNKMLGIAIRYYSVEQKKIISTFLRLIYIENGTAESIVNAIKKLLIDAKLQLIKMQGIGTDNASTMVEINSGVYARLKKDVPHLILICDVYVIHFNLLFRKQSKKRCLEILSF